MSRLFFALWPTAITSSALQQICYSINNSVSGNFVRRRNRHVTLAFLGEVNNKTKACLVDKASQINSTSFSLSFEKVLYFQQAKVLSLGLNINTQNEPLNFLVQECRRIQQQCNLVCEARNFVAHVTFARKVNKPQQTLLINPVIWPVTDFVLVSSELTAQGSHYTVLNRWPLVIT